MPSRRAQPTPATLVFFVRHGTTPTTGKVLPGRTPGLHLSEQGTAEAGRAGERLAAVGASALYTSPLERTRETAAAIAKHVNLRPLTDRALLECDFGDWTGKPLAELAKLPEWSVVQHHPSGFRFPSGESFSELRARIAGAIERLVAKHAGESIVVVSHADPIKIAIGDALGQPLDLVQRIAVAPCSISVVAYGAGAPSVLTTSSSGDLAALARAQRANGAPRVNKGV
ncbi:MAG: histidine phosphatase family protein [Actinomycetota bacterium]|nr:histidine phosphatase family protein [Actinomycetota bacterium]